ncbi:MAG: phosphoribosylformylglycinamidine synthase subunit PurS [Chloroflexota bacterium]|jgi:phosphoribosylformylglycinamidine synthase|nr:phosphoribosylformylglycinamidine synthase subunit PurS [Chloroflexota bacterium]MDP6508136.1 phosphoribosylformylglycinamidine synthase subunit PurS [Chloroflexota bacterium]MDP6758321.1 phosphoribosylformylglycinamidine synthase subunit PurS [Chloroflexota bacterium]
MNNYRVKVTVRLQPEVVDPVGATVEASLHSLGFEGVSGARVGKVVEFALAAGSLAEAEKDAAAMSEQLLANPVIEDHEIEVTEAVTRAPA